MESSRTPFVAAPSTHGAAPDVPLPETTAVGEPIRITPLPAWTPRELAERVAQVAASMPAPRVLVVDASALGPVVPATHEVVETMRRGDRVVAERVGPSGIERTVLTHGLPLPHAGARPLPDGSRQFPPEDLAATLASLRAETHDLDGIVLVLRTPVGPRAVATHAASPGLAAALGLTDADAVLVHAQSDPAADTGVGPSARGAHPSEDVPTPAPTRGTDVDHPWEIGRYEWARRAFGLEAGTPAAIEVGLPRVRTSGNTTSPPGGHRPALGSPRPQDGNSAAGDLSDEGDLDERVARAARLALVPLAAPPSWHPLARLVRTRVDLATVRFSVLQTGVRLEAPDDLTLGVAVGRLVVALGVEGLTGVPVVHEATPAGPACLVGFLLAEER